MFKHIKKKVYDLQIKGQNGTDYVDEYIKMIHRVTDDKK